MNELAIAPIGVEGDISLEQSGYVEWAQCVRRLLGWSGGENADWPELFASGHTPRDVARAVVYGDSSSGD